MNESITIECPNTPAYVGLLVEKSQNARHNPTPDQGAETLPPFHRGEALAVMDNLSILCEDPKARALFRGLYTSLR